MVFVNVLNVQHHHFNQSTDGSVTDDLMSFAPLHHPATASLQHTKTTTAMKIQVLHRAYVKEQSLRRSTIKRRSRSSLKARKKAKRAPAFNMNKGSLLNLYSFLKAMFEDTMDALAEADEALKDPLSGATPAAAAGDEEVDSDDVDGDGDGDGDDEAVSPMPSEVPRQKSKIQELADFGAALNVLSLSPRSDVGSGSGRSGRSGPSEVIHKMSSFSQDESLLGTYEHDRARYDPLYGCTPTTDEMTCYLSLCRVIFSEALCREYGISIGLKTPWTDRITQ